MAINEDLEKLSNTELAKQWMGSNKNNKSDYDPLITYFFINKSKQMSAGKVAVQTARAGQVMLLNEINHQDTLLLDSLSELTKDEFFHGNKTITLKANESQMNRLLFDDLKEKLNELAINNEVPIRLYPVFDIGATEVETNSLTVIAMTPVKKSIIQKFIKKFQLY